MIISMVAAMAHNRVIGLNNQMPWHLPADLAHFKQVTLGKPVLMGRRTYDSIGRLLPGRRNIVISRQTKPAGFSGDWVGSVEEALALLADIPELMVIGGGELYKQLLPLANRLYLTEIDLTTTGDAWFPDYQSVANWRLISEQLRPADAQNPHDCRFITLERID
jgi:dihydrofolate reductase